MLNFQRNTSGRYHQDPDNQIIQLAQERAGYNLEPETIRELVVAARERMTTKLGSQATVLEDPYTMLKLFQERTAEVVEAERPYRLVLQDLAARIVREHFGLTTSVEIHVQGSLMDPEHMNDLGPCPDQVEITPETAAAVTKRRLTNAIIQGGSANLDQLIHLYKEELDNIDPSLFERQIHHHYLANAQFYTFNDVLAAIPDGDPLPTLGGYMCVSQTNQGVDIHCHAVTFTVLVHELCKGVLETLALVGREGDDALRAQVESRADDPRLEGLDIFLGREIWQRLVRTSEHRGMSFYQDLQRLFELDPIAFHREIRHRCTSKG
jgi:hypothetical protein